ncbi:MAG: hypothetical protein SOZ34_09250, partial [Clostridia bacterium]|nr:hypothetical protein [Clostridia bacterium]
ATYFENKVFDTVAYRTGSVAAKTNETDTYNFDLTKVPANGKIKFFFWESDENGAFSLKPIGSAREFDYNDVVVSYTTGKFSALDIQLESVANPTLLTKENVELTSVSGTAPEVENVVYDLSTNNATVYLEQQDTYENSYTVKIGGVLESKIVDTYDYNEAVMNRVSVKNVKVNENIAAISVYNASFEDVSVTVKAYDEKENILASVAVDVPSEATAVCEMDVTGIEGIASYGL